MQISAFEWDDGNELHLALKHGIEPHEAEEVFAGKPLIRKTRRGHYAAFGRSQSGRLLVIVFEVRSAGAVRIITGWDMNAAEQRYYRAHRKG